MRRLLTVVLAASASEHLVFGRTSDSSSLLAANAAAAASPGFLSSARIISARALPLEKAQGRLLSHRLLLASDKHASQVSLLDEETQVSENASLHRRTLLNYMLVSAAAAAGGTAATLFPPLQAANAFPFGPSPPSSGGPKTTEALDRSGQPILASQFLATKSGGDRTMVQGLKSDPTYLIVTVEGGGLEPYAINAECTHLGCLVPWDPIQKKFECPCHGSQYDARGSVIRGPAPGPLKLAKVSTEEDTGKVLLENWADEDFRTGKKPWWV
mmetsp:Transcript_27369/g.78882  ORF Transcript_27369/g.78882 Transcript_27369/m.78882 type:complete len:271 (-) Transcript_27369:712-1524(-)